MSSAETITTWGNFVGGRWVNEGEPFEVIEPYSKCVAGRTYRAPEAQVEKAIASANATFQITRKLSGSDRHRVLCGIAEGIAARREEFARVLAGEAGKPIKAARAEVDRAIFTFTVAAEESTRIGGEWLPLDRKISASGYWGLLRRVPLGPIAAITPFNFPLNLVAHKWAPAIAAGCTIVHKPAPQTPLSALLLAQLVEGTDWPSGALNVLSLSNQVASKIVKDDRLKLLTFTGSAATGWALKSQAAKKHIALELGGNAGVIVHDDADIEDAATKCAAGAFYYAGQDCTSVQRIRVQRRVYEQFLTYLLSGAQRLKLGDPLDETTDIGPMISEAAAQRAAEVVEEAVRQGSRRLYGGEVKGNFFPPTVITATRPEMRVNREEIFAPVVTVEPYDEFTEALAEIDNSSFGMQAGLFTRDAERIFRAYEDIDVGGLIVGDVPTFRVDEMPYGGVKDSGLGREGLRYSIEGMTERKLLVMNLGRN